MPYISNGIDVTANTTDFETKFDKMAETLNETLTKSQKALKLQYDANQRLVNSQGLVVEGLSLSQIKLGQWVDELGNARTFQGGFVAGLSKSQQELGFFADSLGNVYNRMGQLVKESEFAAKQADEIAGHFRASRDAIGDLGGQMASVFSMIASASDGANTLAASFAALGEGASVAVDVARYADELAAAMKGVGAAGDVASAGASAFSGVLAGMAGPGGWLALGVGALAGATVGLTTFASQAKSNETIVNELGMSFEELRRRAEKAGDSIRGVADIVAAAGITGLAGYAEELKAFEKIKLAQAKIARLKKSRDNTVVNGDAGLAIIDSIDARIRSEQKKVNEADEVLAKYALNVAAGYVTQEEKLRENLKIFDGLIQYSRESGSSEEKIAGLTKIREKIAQDLAEAQLKEQNTAEDKAAAEAKRAEEAAKRAEEERKRNLRNSIDLGDLSGALNGLNQEKLTFSEESFDADAKRLGELVKEGVYTAKEANAIILAAYDRNAKAAEAAAEAAEKAAAEEKKRADAAAEKAAADARRKELDAMRDWGFPALKKAAEGPTSELIRLGGLFAQINADAAAMPNLADEAQTALLGVANQMATHYDNIAKAASSSALDGKGLDALDKARADLKKALDAGKISEEYHRKATKELADAMVRETQRINQARRDEAKKKQDEEKLAAEREKQSATERRAKEVADYLDSLKTPWEMYLEELAALEKDRKAGIIKSDADLNALKNKAWSEYLSKTPTVDKQAAATRGDAWSAKTAGDRTSGSGAATFSAASAELYRAQLSQANDKQSQMLATLDNTQIVVRDSFAMLNSLVLSIRQNLENDYNNRNAAVFRGLAAQTARNYGA